jgi:PKD repeat protein
MRSVHFFPLIVGAALLLSCSGDNSGPSAVVLPNGQPSGQPSGQPNDPPSDPPNGAPTAMFSFSCNGFSCAFINQSTAGDTARQVAHAWSFGDGQASTATNPAHTYGNGGKYEVRLTVTDSWGATGSIAKSVAVPIMAPPTDLPWTITANCESRRCSFYSDGPSASSYLLRWDFGDGVTSTERSPLHYYGATVPTAYTVTLTAWSWDGSLSVTPVGSISKAITVTPIPLVVAFSAACSSLVCTFTDQSTGILAGIYTWYWDFGDGVATEFYNPTHVYNVSEPTTFTVTLRLKDFEGFDYVTSQSLTVTPPAPPPCGSPPDC